MKNIFRKHYKTVLFVLGGTLVGLAYWRFIGCTSGSCPLTSNWHTSALFGGLIGYFASPSNRKPVQQESLDKQDSAGRATTPGKS